MILRMASLLVFFGGWFSSRHHGWRPDPAPFFRGSTRCCRKTNEKRARQLRTTKLRNIKKLAEHLLGPELSRTIRDAENLIQKMSREHQETLHLLPMPQGTPYSQTSETYFLNSQCTQSVRYIQKASNNVRSFLISRGDGLSFKGHL